MTKKSSESSQRERRRRVKSEDIIFTKEMVEEIKALKRRKINLSDNDASEIMDWKGASVGKFYRPIKKQITLRVDADVLDWFKHAAKKYQTLINQACREYMEHHLLLKKNRGKKEARKIR